MPRTTPRASVLMPRETPELPPYRIDWPNAPYPMGFDTHFHEGRMRTQEKRTKFQSDFDLGGGITNECNPTNFVDVDHQTGMSRRLATIMRQAGKLNVYVALGIHPKQAGAAISEDDWFAYRSLLRSRSFIAVGEFGLDNSRGSHAPVDKQVEVASRCMDLAMELDLPMIIHQRNSENQMLQLFRAKRVNPDQELHLHCFTGSRQQAEEWLTHFPRARFGVTNLVTFPSATKVHELVRTLPMEKLLLETDAPYFRPPGVSDRRSTPRLLRHVVAQVAALRGLSQYEVLRQNRKNAEATYGICLDGRL